MPSRLLVYFYCTNLYIVSGGAGVSVSYPALQVLSYFLAHPCSERPLILPIYLSSAAHDFATLTSYTHFCFFAYIRRSARPPWPSFSSSRPSTPHLSSSPQPSSPQPSTPTSSSVSSSSIAAFSDYIAESCYWYSQNTPTVVLLLPRAALSLSLLLTSTQPGVGRDSTYFDANGALTGYARGILFTNAAWTAWRTLVLIGSM